jgi:molybdopterin synthase sulfur carrier subunit
MPVVIRVPAPLRSTAGGQRQIELTAPDFGLLLEEMEATYPGITKRLRDEDGALRRTLNIYINGENIRFLRGLATPLRDGDEVSIVPAIAGGERRAADLATRHDGYVRGS